MKHCPRCNATFTDDYLIYCTDDGTVLVTVESSASGDGQATQVLAEPPPTMVMPPPAPTAYAPVAPANQPQPPRQPQPYGWANSAPPSVPPAWAPPPAPAPLYARPVGMQQQQQTLAIVSLCCGIASITFGWLCGGPVLGPVAAILGFIALMQIRKDPVKYGGKPIALAGLITGGVVSLCYIAIFLFWIVMMIIGAASS